MEEPEVGEHVFKFFSSEGVNVVDHVAKLATWRWSFQMFKRRVEKASGHSVGLFILGCGSVGWV